MATELSVTHGAVGQWESGKREIPGPVERLLDLYEEELGLAPSSWRGLALARVATDAATGSVAAMLEEMLRSHPHHNAVSRRAHARVAQNVVRSLGRMKGLAMKLGQALSYVDFALPEEAQRALADIEQQEHTAMPPSLTAQIIHAELGETPRELFAEWSPQPLATASIGQVHAATLKSGERVAVKVQYPGIEAAFDADMANARALERVTGMLFRGQQRGAVLDELTARFAEECDYRVEAAHQRRFREAWRGSASVLVPRVHRATRRVLVSDFAPGERLPSHARRATRAERSATGEAIWAFAFVSIFRHHLFQADPHPGNYLVGADGAVTFVDFGCVKRFDPAQVDCWRRFARALLERRFADADEACIEMGLVPHPTRFDFAYHRRMMLELYRPWLVDEPFTYDAKHMRRLWRAFMLDNPNKFRTNIPSQWVLVNRLQWGTYAVLAKLGARANWRRKILPLLYGDDTPPDPYHPSELRQLGL